MLSPREFRALETIAKKILNGIAGTYPLFLFLFPEEEKEGSGWKLDNRGITRIHKPILTRREYNRILERCRLKSSPKIITKLFLGRNLQKLKPKEKVILLPLFNGFLLKGASLEGIREEKRTLKAYGTFTSLVLKEFWQRLSAEKQAKGSRELLSVIEAIHSSNNIEELFQMITEKTSDLFPQVDLVTLTVFNNGGKPLWYRMGPSKDQFSTTPSPVEIGITDLLRKKEKPLLFLSGKKLKKALNLSSEDNMISSTLSIPITTNGKKIGALHLESLSRKRAFSPFDLELLQGFANEASLAIERTRAHETLKKKAHRLKVEAETLQITYAQLMQSEKLASIGELAGSIAHEINNPLMTLMGRIELLLNKIPSSDPNRPYLKIMNREVERIGNLVRGLLQFTKRSKADFQIESIPSIVDECLLLTENYLRNNRINIQRRYPSSLPSISADRNQMVQVFLNLITNAVQSMKEGGTILILMDSMEETVASSGEWIEIHFQDSGRGISLEESKHVFEPFVTTKKNGTGLGLSVSKRIIEDHGGKIFIDSRVHKGTRVTIQLPRSLDIIRYRKEEK
jgi:signal transduction histidine kinase